MDGGFMSVALETELRNCSPAQCDDKPTRRNSPDDDRRRDGAAARTTRLVTTDN
jgi:hypothetical protein